MPVGPAGNHPIASPSYDASVVKSETRMRSWAETFLGPLLGIAVGVSWVGALLVVYRAATLFWPEFDRIAVNSTSQIKRYLDQSIVER